MVQSARIATVLWAIGVDRTWRTEPPDYSHSTVFGNLLASSIPVLKIGQLCAIIADSFLGRCNVVVGIADLTTGEKKKSDAQTVGSTANACTGTAAGPVRNLHLLDLRQNICV